MSEEGPSAHLDGRWVGEASADTDEVLHQKMSKIWLAVNLQGYFYASVFEPET